MRNGRELLKESKRLRKIDCSIDLMDRSRQSVC